MTPFPPPGISRSRLEILVRALAAAHPVLSDEEFPKRASESARIADDVLDLVKKQQYALARYRWAVRCELTLDLEPESDDLADFDTSDIPF
jgi:hypothetical protein